MEIIMPHTLNYIIAAANTGDQQAVEKFKSILNRLVKIEGKEFLIIQDESISL